MKGLLLLAALAGPAVAADNYDAVFRAYGAYHRVDWRLLKAVAIAESSLDPMALNEADPSVGLMGVLCRRGRRGTCNNHFDITDWPPPSREVLRHPALNVHYGAQILAWNIRHYGLAQGVALYNARSALRTPAGHPFPNQRYVTQVLRTYRALQHTTGEKHGH